MDKIPCCRCGQQQVVQYGIFQKCNTCQDETIAPASDWTMAVKVLQALRDCMCEEGIEFWLTSYRTGRSEALKHVPIEAMIASVRKRLDGIQPEVVFLNG